MRRSRFFRWFLFLLAVGLLLLLFNGGANSRGDDGEVELRQQGDDGEVELRQQGDDGEVKLREQGNDEEVELRQQGDEATHGPGLLHQWSPTKRHVSADIISLPLASIGLSNSPTREPLKDAAADIRAPAGWKKMQQQMEVQKMRLNNLAKVCSQFYQDLKQITMSKKHLSFIMVEDRTRLLFCWVPKVGCTNWKMLLTVLSGKVNSLKDLNPWAIHGNHGLGELKNNSPEEVEQLLNNYTLVMFAREPFERLVSGFRNKFEDENKYYRQGVGRRIIAKYRPNATEEALKTGSDVTFREFVRFLLDEQHTSELDMHWRPVNRMCHPCLFKYNFVGKAENMNNESEFLLWSIGAPQNVSLPEAKYGYGPQDVRTGDTVMRKYFSQLNAAERQGIYDLFRMDYMLFDYPKPFPDLH